MRRLKIVSAIVFFLFVAVIGAPAQVRKQAQPAMKVERPTTQLLSISKVRGPEMTKFVNKQVTIEGFYYDGSIPMVIDDI